LINLPELRDQTERAAFALSLLLAVGATLAEQKPAIDQGARVQVGQLGVGEANAQLVAHKLHQDGVDVFYL
jgi:hypothetical protein